MINEITSDNRSMKAKEYMFHVDLIHLETYYEDWYEEFPVLLTDEEFDELCKTQRMDKPSFRCRRRIFYKKALSQHLPQGKNKLGKVCPL